MIHAHSPRTFFFFVSAGRITPVQASTGTRRWIVTRYLGLASCKALHSHARKPGIKPDSSGSAPLVLVGDASQCQIGIRSSQLYGIKTDQTGTEVQAVVFKLKNKTYKSPSHPLDTKPSSITQIIAVSHDCISQTGGQAVSSHN